MTTSQTERLKPEFAGLVLTLHMNMWRLAAIEAGEEEPIGAGDALDSWHSDAALRIDTIAQPESAAPADLSRTRASGSQLPPNGRGRRATFPSRLQVRSRLQTPSRRHYRSRGGSGRLPDGVSGPVTAPGGLPAAPQDLWWLRTPFPTVLQARRRARNTAFGARGAQEAAGADDAAAPAGAVIGACRSNEMIGRLPYRRTFAMDRPTCFGRSFPRSWPHPATIASTRWPPQYPPGLPQWVHMRGANDQHPTSAMRCGCPCPLGGDEKGGRLPANHRIKHQVLFPWVTGALFPGRRGGVPIAKRRARAYRSSDETKRTTRR